MSLHAWGDISAYTRTPPGTCDHARVTRTGPSTRRTGDTATRPQVTVRSRVRVPKRVESRDVSRVIDGPHTIQIKKGGGGTNASHGSTLAQLPHAGRHRRTPCGHITHTISVQEISLISSSSVSGLPVYAGTERHAKRLPSTPSSAHTHDNHPLTSSRPSSRPRTRIHAIVFM